MIFTIKCQSQAQGIELLFNF